MHLKLQRKRQSPPFCINKQVALAKPAALVPPISLLHLSIPSFYLGQSMQIDPQGPEKLS